MRLRNVVIPLWLSIAAAGFVCAQDQPDQGDPPSRVARLNYLNGSVSFRPATVEDWAPATINYPLTTGDHLWTDKESGAEMHVGSTAIRLAGNTAFAILNLDDRTAQLSVSDGFINVRLRNLESDETFEIDTPNGAVSLLRPGNYRIDVDQDGNTTSVTVREGEAEVTGGGQAFAVHSHELGRFSGTDDQLASTIHSALSPDEWDRWCVDRDVREDRSYSASAAYVPPDMIGAEDLGNNGVWSEEPDYGPVWRPTHIEIGWAPYRYGHWAYVVPWGWTWIDDAPWGFAPFHYGRWAMIRGGWCWAPGRRVVRPVYAPALVAFVGGRGFGAAISVGGGGFAAWVPLGPREVYHPPYHVSNVYVRNVNVTHVTNITQVNVTNVNYVNRTYVTAVPQGAFAGARPVRGSMVRVPPNAVNHIERVNVVNVRPDRASYLGRPVQPGTRVVVPPARIASRPVVVRTAPPVSVRNVTPVRVAPPVNAGRPGFHPQQGNRPGQPNLPNVQNTQGPRPGNTDRPGFNRPGQGNMPQQSNTPQVNVPGRNANDRPQNNPPQGYTQHPANNDRPQFNRPPQNNAPQVQSNERRPADEPRNQNDRPQFNRPPQNNTPQVQNNDRPRPADIPRNQNDRPQFNRPPQNNTPQVQNNDRRPDNEPRNPNDRPQFNRPPQNNTPQVQNNDRRPDNEPRNQNDRPQFNRPPQNNTPQVQNNERPRPADQPHNDRPQFNRPAQQDNNRARESENFRRNNDRPQVNTPAPRPERNEPQRVERPAPQQHNDRPPERHTDRAPDKSDKKDK